MHKCVSRFSKSNLQHPKIEPLTIGKRISGAQNSYPNNTDINNTDFIENDPIYSEDAGGEMMRVSLKGKAIGKWYGNIGYQYLVQSCDRERLNEIVDLMVDTICTTQDYIVIGG